MASHSNSEFGWSLLKTLITDSDNDGKNLFLSPFSISLALALTSLGAQGDTAIAMEKAMCWSGDGQRIHNDYHKYLMKLQQPSSTESGTSHPSQANERPKLKTANRIYVEETYKILDSFMDQAKSLYIAEPVPVDFRNNPEDKRLHINKWVEEQTEDKIKDLLQQGVINSDTAMVLVNAIYFKGYWLHKFDESDTFPQDFFASSSNTKSVHMMHMCKRFAYFKATNYALLELPYQGRELSMVILLPDEKFGLKALEQTVSMEEVKESLTKLDSRSEIDVSLPKFEINYSMEMKSILSQMGMEVAFDSKMADFSGMTGSRELFISNVVHKSFLKVEETGTEAAAATAVSMCLMSAMIREVEPKRFVVDHPFLVIIRDKTDDVILFMGNVNDPPSV